MTTFEQRFAPLFAELTNPEAEFHGATMLEALLALEPLVALQSAEAARLYREVAVLQAKRDQVDCFDYADKTLAAQAVTGALAPDRLYFMHTECSQVVTYERSDSLRLFEHIRAALAIADSAGAPPNHVLRLRQDYGKWLAVFERHEEAFASNMALLADAEAFFGAGSRDLRQILCHIALNHRSLGRPAEALRWYARKLSVMQPGLDGSSIVYTQMEVAEVHCELGQFDQAKAALAAMLVCAEATADEYLIARAKEAYVENFHVDGRPVANHH